MVAEMLMSRFGGIRLGVHGDRRSTEVVSFSFSYHMDHMLYIKRGKIGHPLFKRDAF